MIAGDNEFEARRKIKEVFAHELGRDGVTAS
jgi:hypothetical protein